jgi:RNA polymerase sigma-70 factor (ECF subfamily)
VSDTISAAHFERVERFRALYDRAYPRIVAYVARRARSMSDSDDIVAEVFATAWRRLDDIPTDERATPWFYGVARRTLANHYRSADRRSRLHERLREQPAGSDGGFELVHEALDRLKPDDREILTLNVWDDLDSPDIAMVLGIPPTTAAVRLHRAKKRFAREWERRGTRNPNQVKSEGAVRTPGVVNGTELGEVTRE